MFGFGSRDKTAKAPKVDFFTGEVRRKPSDVVNNPIVQEKLKHLKVPGETSAETPRSR